MLTQEENDYLTKVGRGTPCGEMMRRYWHPIYPEAKLRDNPVAKIRILCEDLVLFRDRSGKLGLVEERCPHRMVSLSVGIPEEDGIRCPYHGWKFGHDGRCLEQPLEPADGVFKDKVQIQSYPVEEMGGLIWAYLGPQPAPLLPRWNLFVRPDGFRQIVAHQLPCNWLQVQENRADLGHATYLHGRLFQYALERKGVLTDDPNGRYNAAMRNQEDMMQKKAYVQYRPVHNQFGFSKGFKKSYQDENEKLWQVGFNPILFPYTLAFGPEEGGTIRRSYQIGVPIDDTHTWHFQYFCYVFPKGIEVPRQEYVPHAEVPLKNEKGEYQLDYVLGQDMVAWVEQGEIADRRREHLGASDALVTAYRRLLRTQIDLVRDGQDPLNVFRNPEEIDQSELDIVGHGEDDTLKSSGTVVYRHRYHKVSKGGWLYIDDDADRYCPDRDQIVSLLEQSEALTATASRPRDGQLVDAGE
jgi:5,5'-dehydrodivanillate O-demethylase